MSATPPPPEPRAILWLPKTELSIHDAVRQTPEDRALVELLANEFVAKIAAGIDPKRIIRDALEITSAKEVEDGRHRFLAAMRVPQMKLLPCIIDDECDPETLVIEKLTQRRHYSKSAKAYALRHMAARIAEANKARTQGGNLKRGVESPGSRLNQQPGAKGSETIDELAAKTLLSRDLLLQAIKLERYFVEFSDTVLAGWLENSPDHAESWLAWQDSNPNIEMPWSCWRAKTLAEMGVADDAKSINVIVKNWREIEEDKIFNGVTEPDGESDDRRSYSLGAALKAMGSYHATAGQPRNDLNPEGNILFHSVLCSKIQSFSKTAWANWDKVDPAGRLEVINNLSLHIIGGTDAKGRQIEPWPEDVRRAILVKLNGKGGDK